MKKYITLILFFIIFSNLQAQIIKSYGFKIGVSITSQYWEWSDKVWWLSNFDTDNKIGINVGAYCELINDSVFTIITEVNYIQNAVQKKGFGIAVSPADSPEPISSNNPWALRIDYIELSILGKAKTDYGLFSPYFLFGPRLAIEINKSIQNDISTFYNDFNKNIFGLKFGIGTEVKISILNFLAEFIYNLDFNNLCKKEYLEVTSNSYDFRVGVFFNL